MKLVQLKWSDEKEWKNYEPAEKDEDAQLKRLKKLWENDKKKYKLNLE